MNSLGPPSLDLSHSMRSVADSINSRWNNILETRPIFISACLIAFISRSPASAFYWYFPYRAQWLLTIMSLAAKSALTLYVFPYSLLKIPDNSWTVLSYHCLWKDPVDSFLKCIFSFRWSLLVLFLAVHGLPCVEETRRSSKALQSTLPPKTRRALFSMTL